MKIIPSKESIVLAIAAAGLGFAGRDAIDESEVQNKITIQRSLSKKVKLNGETRFVAPLEFADGGQLDVLLSEAPCVIPELDSNGNESEVDCRCKEAPDAGARWRGRNVCPRELSEGSQCIPSACSIVSGQKEDALY